jgi:thioredoxin-related protein
MLRRLPTLPLAFAVLLLVAPSVARAGGEIPWRTFDAGLREARAKDRPVMVDVFTDWCRYCKMMDRDVYSRADVREYLGRHYVVVRLDAEGAQRATYEGHTHTGASLAQRFRVNSYPTTIFLRADGTHLVNVPGYVEPGRFLMLLRYVAEGAMERGEDFEAFARRAAGAAR